MPVKKLIVTGSATRPPSNSSPEGPTKGSPTDDGGLTMPKLSGTRTKPRTRLRKTSAVRRPGYGPDVVPCPWVSSNHGEDYESMKHFQVYGQKQGLHLPDIKDKKGRAAKSMLRIQPKNQIQQFNVNDEGPVIFPALVATGEPRKFNPPRPPTKSPRDYCPSISPPCDHCCDPSQEYNYDPVGECDLPSMDYRDTVRGYRMVPHPPSHPPPVNSRKPPTHLPPLNPRKPGGRRF